MRIGERDAAVALLRDMVTTWPKDEATLEGLQLLGDDAFARKDLSNARADFEASLLSHDPQTKIYAHYRLAWCSWAEGHHPDAITQMSAVAADNSDPTLAKRAAEDLGRMRADGAPRR